MTKSRTNIKECNGSVLKEEVRESRKALQAVTHTQSRKAVLRSALLKRLKRIHAGWE
jgi:hypothetical protein